MDKDKIQSLLGEIVDPSSEKTLKETGGVRYIGIDEDAEKPSVNLIIGLGKDDDQTKAKIRRNIAKVIKIDLGYHGLKIDFELLKKQESILDDDRNIKYIAIASGKGGVGKSTVTANLAVALNRLGKKVGIIDADIYGSSIPTIMEVPVTMPNAREDEKIIPFNKMGVELISTEFFLKKDQPLMWRGPMLGKMLNHFFYDVGWHDELDYILIDLPPGTGDVAMDIQKLIPECEMLIITTPHESASHVAVKAGFAAKELKHNIIGVIENMSYLSHAGETLKIFGEGGGEIVADRLKTEVMQTIPIGQPQGEHHSIFDIKEEIGVIYLGLANKLIKHYQ